MIFSPRSGVFLGVLFSGWAFGLATAAQAEWSDAGQVSGLCLVRDSDTGLAWSTTIQNNVTEAQAEADCRSKGMRLPTEDEFDTARENGLYDENEEFGCLGYREWFFRTANPNVCISLKNGIRGCIPALTTYKCVTDGATPSTPSVDPTPSTPGSVLPQPAKPNLTLNEDLIRERVTKVFLERLNAANTSGCKFYKPTHGYSYRPGTHDFSIGFIANNGGAVQRMSLVINADRSPTDQVMEHAAEITSSFSCAFPNQVDVATTSVAMQKQGMIAVQNNLNAIASANANPPPTGKLKLPSIIVSKDEYIIVDPVDAATQQRLAEQAYHPIHPAGVTTNHPGSGPYPFKQTFGDDNTVSLTFSSQTKSPGTSLDAEASAGADLSVFGNHTSIISGSMQTSRPGNRFGVRLQGQVSFLGKVYKTIDEEASASLVHDEERFIDNAELYSLPPYCAPTPIGPACLEGRFVGTIGVKPSGVTFPVEDPADFKAFVLPYARVDFDLFGGVEYGVAHAGLRGQFAVLDGTIGLLAGDVNGPRMPRCTRIELDSVKTLNGSLFLDVQALQEAGIDGPSPDEIRGLCQNIKDQGGQVVDLGRSIEQGAEHLPAELANTRNQLADAGKHQIVDPIVNGLSDTGNTISDATGGIFSARLNLRGAHSHSFDAGIRIPDFESIDCDQVADGASQILSGRYVKKIYDWDGITLAAHQKWFEACDQQRNF